MFLSYGNKQFSLLAKIQWLIHGNCSRNQRILIRPWVKESIIQIVMSVSPVADYLKNSLRFYSLYRNLLMDLKAI
jgi:hypothetical protein